TLQPRAPPLKPVLVHGRFAFSVLICSELTDIASRARLRGWIDALFVHEWNKDVVYFEPVVAASSQDLHAFVAQVNNRLYGDSWVRAPATNQWERDLVRLKGGDSDIFSVAVVPVGDLRRF